ncbi:MAG: c-type cytochrome [Desulfosarcinaceae bacterium]|nr:c-type cytochrome [Desulfosarcinaceae bacterium]
MKQVIGLFSFVVLVLLAAYGLITAYDYSLSVGRMWETPAIRPHEQPIPVNAIGIVPVDGGEVRLRHTPDRELLSPLDMDDATHIAAGKKGYFTYCAQCHGKYHDGNGTVGQSFAPLPGDLRSEKVQSMVNGTLFKEISYGVPGERQPALATTIAVPERWQIIAYVKSLGER